MRRTPALLFVLLATALLAPGTASAFMSYDTAGHRPRVAVNEAGTRFLTWTSPSGSYDVFRYCRVAYGAGTCNAQLSYTPADSDVVGGYTLFATGGRVLLVDARCCGSGSYAFKQVFTSTDGGATFPTQTSPGHMDGAGDNIAGQAIYAPAGAAGRGTESILTISDGTGVTFQATGTGAGSETATANLGSGVPGGGASYQGSLALQGHTNPVATMATLDKLYWRKWKGTGDVNDVTNWTPAALLDTTNVNSTAKLVSGPSDVYVAYSTGATNHQRFVLRKFTGTGWGAPIALTPAGNPSNGDLVEDPTGRLHFAWQQAGKLHYRYSRTPANVSFSQAQTLPAPGDNFPFLKLAVNSHGIGLGVWDNLPGIRTFKIRPGEPPYNGPTKRTSTPVGNAKLVMTSPELCVGPGQVFYARFGTKPKKKGQKVDAKIRKVVVSLDGKQRAPRTTKPFEIRVPTKGLGSGNHTLKAEVTLEVRKTGKTKTVTKTLQTTLSIC
jgi:hypothetical protein